MTVIQLKTIIALKLGIPMSTIAAEDFRAYGVRFKYHGNMYRATTDLTIEKVEGACLVTDDDTRQIENILRVEEWNGEGLPPVGCRVETLFNGEWVEATVAYTGRPESSGAADTCKWKEALVFDCKTTRPFWADELRPIRSEADKKRDEVGEAIYRAINWNHEGSVERNSRFEDYCKVYDAIAAGKVPGIRIK